MAVLICKICGGHLEVTGQSTALCDSCGTEVTIPKVDSDNKAEFYNRANYFRTNKDFDRAYSEFEHIVAENGDDAEAYWSLSLCRYGITYEQNPANGEYELVVNNMRREPIMEDMDYIKALEKSDAYTGEIYRAEAEKIKRIQAMYFDISSKNEPYDVYLCEGDGGSSASIARLLKEKLEEKKLRVFSLQNKRFYSAAEREANIFYGLNSARIMLVISTAENDLTPLFVKNQWSRFLHLAANDKSKHIVPIYSGIDVYGMPEQIPTHEAVCADNDGYWQDVTRGILQMLGRLNTQAPAVQQQNVPNAQAFLEEAKKALATKNYTATELMAQQAQTYEPENGMVHYYLLMGKNKASSFDELIDRPVDWSADTTLKRVITFGEGSIKQEAERFLTAYINRTNYKKAKKLMENEEYDAALPLLKGLGNLWDAPTVYEQCKKLAHHKKTLANYNAETNGNPAMHLYNKIKTAHRDVFDALIAKIKSEKTALRAESEPYLSLISAIMMFLAGAVTLIDANRSVLFGEGFGELVGLVLAFEVFQILGALIYGYKVLDSKLKTVIYMGISFFLMTVFIHEAYDGADNIIFGLLPLRNYLVEAKKERHYKKVKNELEAYDANTVIPLEDSIKSDIYKRYGDVLTTEEIGSFERVRTLAESLDS